MNDLNSCARLFNCLLTSKPTQEQAIMNKMEPISFIIFSSLFLQHLHQTISMLVVYFILKSFRLLKRKEHVSFKNVFMEQMFERTAFFHLFNRSTARGANDRHACMKYVQKCLYIDFFSDFIDENDFRRHRA